MGKTSEALSIINNDLEIEGTLVSRGRLIIKGVARGELSGDAVIIQEKGLFNGNAKVNRITIGGRFEGDLAASGEMVVLSTGSFTGNATCREIRVESGGLLNGSVTCLDRPSAQPQGQPLLKKIP